MRFSSKRTAAYFVCAALVTWVSGAQANPVLVIDADSGQTLIERQSTANWYPASLTKLMTVYVALSAVRDGRITMDTPFVVSAHAASMPPSKMGFQPGIQVTLDNALKMLMVKSPNDVAVTIAEGVSGSVDSFAGEMNGAAAKLGLRESHFVNPNGLPDTRQVTSARDMAMIGRALIREFPQYNYLFGIGALQLNSQIIMGHNGLIGRYPGADGMKTGFTCAAGFNLVASATQNGRRLIAVVLGSPSPRERTAEAAGLLDRGFAQWGGGLGPVESLPSPGVGAAPDMHGEICSRRGRAAIAAGEDEELAPTPAEASGRRGAGAGTIYAAAVATRSLSPQALAASEPAHFDPVPVFLGPKPGWTGAVAAARPASPITLKGDAAPIAPQATAFAPAESPSDKATVDDPNATPVLTAPIALHNSAVPAAGLKPTGVKIAPRWAPKPAPKPAVARLVAPAAAGGKNAPPPPARPKPPGTVVSPPGAQQTP